MKKRTLIIFILLVLLFLLKQNPLIAQTAPTEGIRKNNSTIYAFVNAKIVVSPGNIINNGTLVIRNGVIENIGEKILPPPDARILDLKGLAIYPGLIESYSNYGMEKSMVSPASSSGGRPVGRESRLEEKPKGTIYWNKNVTARQNSEDLFSPDEKAAEKLRAQGFTSALVIPAKGIFKGSSAVIHLGNQETNFSVIKKNTSQNLSFEADISRFEEGNQYPNSLMGAIALIRQVFYDALWYRKATEYFVQNHNFKRPETNDDLNAIDKSLQNKTPFVFEVTDELNFLRAAKLIKEFNLQGIIKGSGYEYRRLGAIKKTGIPVILPLNFPEQPSVNTPEDALTVSLAELRHWEAAPDNPHIISEAGIPFMLTSANLKEPSSFLIQVRKAIERGLTNDEALASLTTIPAKYFGIDKLLGSIEKGKIADFVISDGDLFAEKTRILEVWIDGIKYDVKPKPEIDPRGTWTIKMKTESRIDRFALTLKGESDKIEGSLFKNKRESKLTNALISGLNLALVFFGDSIDYPGIIRMTGNFNAKEIAGIGELPDGKQFSWSGVIQSSFEPPRDTVKKKPDKGLNLEPVYPSVGFGRKKSPEQPEYLLVKDANIWTCGPKGVLKATDLLIKKGIVFQIGQNLNVPKNAFIIDAKGKDITPGIIDCHSHTGVSGQVNESGQAITSETRIEDVIDCNDIAIYRELAGGTTLAKVLHGSANPIGGQSVILKFRWGALPDELIFEKFPPGLKFALGENVKQSNWGDQFTRRYPQTRMGVEQILFDEFQAALEYKKKIEQYEKNKIGIPPRKDLELDPIVEVLEGKRDPYVHAYRQDEMLMFMRLAEKFNFKVGTFDHALEGYKIADLLARHGAGATSFSDWWAYKFEVYDAIPFSGALMDAVGVNVSYNSDSDELARRLNLEAAKAVKYGGVTGESALKFVTINPAKQLKIDKRVGSLEIGKDADFVIWSGDPLSTYTICEQTWIDGKKYFDREEDLKMREEIQKERSLLIQKILKLKKEEGIKSKAKELEKPKENEMIQQTSFEEK